MLETLTKTFLNRLLQYFTSIGGGLLLAFETSIPYFTPCFIAVIIDAYTAWTLGCRVHRKYPERADGKFKSEYKLHILVTMIVCLLAIIVAHHVDIYIIKNSDIAERFIVGVFLFYQIWSILENWSSESDNKIAKALQRIMINKAERHFNVPLGDIMLNEDKQEGGQHGECK